MPEKDKRNTTVTTKMTISERGIGHEKARQCGLAPSDYMRRSAIGHAQKSALTAEEMRLLQNLDGFRTDIINFAYALPELEGNSVLQCSKKCHSCLNGTGRFSR